MSSHCPAEGEAFAPRITSGLLLPRLLHPAPRGMDQAAHTRACPKRDGAENDPGCPDPHSLFQQDEGCRRVHAKILARGLPVVSQIRRPVPLDEQIQELQQPREGKNKQTEDFKKLAREQALYLKAGKDPGQVAFTTKNGL